MRAGYEYNTQKLSLSYLYHSFFSLCSFGAHTCSKGENLLIQTNTHLRTYQTCSICKTNLRGQSYGCVPCAFYIHESCSELLQLQTLHPFHPHSGHCLSRINKYKNAISDKCKACLSRASFFVYQCLACGFCLHPQYASLLPNVK